MAAPLPTTPLPAGTPAPDFTLPGGGGKTVRLADHVGTRTVVLYFYPEDDTPGCTIEACTFRDEYSDFVAAGAEVIGVSNDPPARHDAFIARHKLPFVLASDADGAVRAQYGVVRNMFGMIPGRVTFVIDRKGIIRHTFDSHVRLKGHIATALDVVRTLERER